MDKMVFVAMTGAKQTLRAQTLVNHNLANANTDGFRADLAFFGSAPIYGGGYPTRVNGVTTGAGFNTKAGVLIETGRDLDVAVKGSGWIAVQARDGTEAYTRAGALRVTSLGLLETGTGELVLGDNGPVAVPARQTLTIGGDGTISIVPEGQGPETIAAVGRIKLVDPDLAALVKGGDGLVRLPGEEGATADASVQLVSGYLEASNVNMAAELIDMITLARQFELQVRMMRTADENATRAAELVRVS